jgi:hypothetical protein
MRHLPPNTSVSRPERLPANGRNLLVFSDSRQRAAFLAPYLRQTMAETAYLGPIQSALEEAETREGPVTVEQIADQYVRNLKPDKLPIPVIRKRDDLGLEHYKLVSTADLSGASKEGARHEAKVSLFRHVCSSTKQRGTLTGLGIAALAVDISDFRLNEMENALPELFADGKKRGRELIEALLTVFAQKGAIAFPEPLTARDILRFGRIQRRLTLFTALRRGALVAAPSHVGTRM